MSQLAIGGCSSNPCELLGTYQQASGAALADLDNFENYSRKLRENAPIALSYLKQLSSAACVDDDRVRKNIEGVMRSIRENKLEQQAEHMLDHLSFGEKNCYPIGDGYPAAAALSRRSLLVYANYHAGYYYDYASSLKRGYDGNLRNFESLLNLLESLKGLRPVSDVIARLKKLISDRHDAKSAADLAASLETSLSSTAISCRSPAGCDKINLFLGYLKSAQNRKIDVTLFSLPGKMPRRAARTRAFCRKASLKGIKCVNLWAPMARHYRARGSSGFYLDGAHLNAEGSANVARWMASELFPAESQKR